MECLSTGKGEAQGLRLPAADVDTPGKSSEAFAISLYLSYTCCVVLAGCLNLSGSQLVDL